MLSVLIAITRGEPGGAQVHVHELLRGLRDRVKLHLAIGVATGGDAWLPDEARRLGVPVTVVAGLGRSVSPVADLRSIGAFRTAVRALRPDLVHTHSTKAGLVGRWAAALAGVPAVHTAHSWSFSDGIRRRQKAVAIPVEAITARLTRRFIVVSEADREVALRWHVAQSAQLRVVYNGVSDVPGRAVPDAAGPPVVVMVARMAPPKDHELLLQALAGIPEPFRVRLVGDGVGRARVEELARLPGLAGRVELLGVRGDVPEVLAGAQVGVLVSRQEGFPLAVLEAMRAGLPVVASDVGGVREAVDEGVTGLLAPRGDVAVLRSGLRRLIVDPGLRRRFGEAGRARFEARFTVQQMLAGTLAVYDEAVRAPGARAA